MIVTIRQSVLIARTLDSDLRIFTQKSELNRHLPFLVGAGGGDVVGLRALDGQLPAPAAMHATSTGIRVVNVLGVASNLLIEAVVGSTSGHEAAERGDWVL